MKTILTSACFLDGLDKDGRGTRVARNIKYINYYSKLKEQLGFDKIWLIDNASSGENIKALRDGIGDNYKNVQLFRCEKRLKSSGHVLDYPYCWRALWTINEMLINSYVQKVIHIDSDGFVLSQRLMDHLRNTKTGWETFWVERYGFPEASLWTLNRDSFSILNNFFAHGWASYNGKLMEVELPFTKVNKEFVTDRFGEDRTMPNESIDYYGQCPVDIPMKFYEGIK